MNFWFKIIFFLLIICAFGACQTASENSKSLERKIIINPNSSKEERITELNKPVFCLSIINPINPKTKRRAIGTGFLVSENILATAFHVKEDLDKAALPVASFKGNIVAWKKFNNGDYIEIPLNSIGSDQDSDITLYSFDAESFKQQAKVTDIYYFSLADRLPNIGEDILSIGYYGIMEFPFNSLGNVSMIDNGEDIYSDMTLLPGNSGSPLISMKTGEVFGLNTKVMTMGDGTIRLGISKKISKLKELIEKSKP